MEYRIEATEEYLKNELNRTIKGEITVSIKHERTKVVISTFAREFTYLLPMDMTNAFSLELKALACAIAEQHMNRVVALYFNLERLK